MNSLLRVFAIGTNATIRRGAIRVLQPERELRGHGTGTP